MSIPPATSFPNSPGWSRLIERLRAATAGRFTIVRELGRGGFAAVFLAQQHQPSRPVAIKLLLPSHLDSEWALEHFRGESQKIANWRHQSVVTIYEVHEVDDLFFFVMSYVEGGSLHDLIATFGMLSVPMTRSVLAQMGSAIQYAHRNGVTHRDIKPQNVLIDTDGGAVVTDFGISKQSGGTSHTVTGMIFGTAPYMAPEQCESGTTSILSDQYALGIVAYEMLTGNAPFVGTATSVLMAHLSKPVPPLRTKRSDVPDDLEAAINRMLEKDPEKRFPSIAEAMRAAGVAELSEFHPDRIAFAQAARRIATEGKTQQLDIVTIPAVLEVGDLIPIAATARTSAGETLADAAIEWSLGDVSLARVDKGNGTLTALEPGITTLYVKSGKVQQQIQIEIRQPRATTIQLSAPPGGIRVGDVKQLGAAALSKRGVVVQAAPRWSSSDPSIAMVSDSGVISAVRAGRALIKAQIEEVTSELWLDVAPQPVADLRVSGVVNALEAGDTRQLRAIVLDSQEHVLTDRPVLWSSSDRRVVAVSDSGLVTGVTVGRATITASCDGRTSSHTIEVRPPRVASVEVLAPSGAVKVGDRVRLNARVRGSGGEPLDRPITWLSDDATIATIDAAGTLVAVAPGTVIVSATVDDVSGATMIDVAARRQATPVVSPVVTPEVIPVATPVLPPAAVPAAPAPVAPVVATADEMSFTQLFGGGVPASRAASSAPAPIAAPIAAQAAPPLAPPPVFREPVPRDVAPREPAPREPAPREPAPRNAPDKELESSRIFGRASASDSPLKVPQNREQAVGATATSMLGVVGAAAPAQPPASQAKATAGGAAASVVVTSGPAARALGLGASLGRTWIAIGAVVVVVGGIVVAMKSGSSATEVAEVGAVDAATLKQHQDSIDKAIRDSIQAAKEAIDRKEPVKVPTPGGNEPPPAVVPKIAVDLTVSQTALSLDKPQTSFDVAVLRDGKRGNGVGVRVQSRDAAVASIRDRTITAHKAGQVWIVASNGKQSDSVQVSITAPASTGTGSGTTSGTTVDPPPPPPVTISRIQLTPISQLERNGVRNIDVQTIGSNGSPMSLNALSVRSSDANVVEATKTNTGIRLTARNTGTATIIVRADNAPAADFTVTVPAPVVAAPVETTTNRPPPSALLSRDDARSFVRSWFDRAGKALPTGLAQGAFTNELRSNLDGISWRPVKDVSVTDVETNGAEVVVIWEGRDGGGSNRRVTAYMHVRVEGGRVQSATLTKKSTYVKP